MTASQWATFLPVAILLALAPGPDNLAVLAFGMSRGPRVALAYAWGCAAGCLNHALLVACGLAAVITASTWALPALRLVGAAYLLWLAWQIMRRAGPAESAPQIAAELPAPRYFVRGLLANAINPKVLLFSLALLPQFVRDGAGPVWQQIIALGAAFALATALVFSGIAILAGRLAPWMRPDSVARRWLDTLTALIFVATAAALFWR